jgi:hypothetical protein
MLRFALCFFSLLLAGLVRADNLGALPEVAFDRLSDRSLSALGQRALTVRPADWKHAETEHFIFHFFDGPTASAVSVEAEFYYRVIAKELGKDTATWERKCHVFMFDQEADWAKFQQGGGLDPWTGGIHADGTLFFRRNPGWRANNQTFPHEVTHLVLHRFFGNGIPLWLHEGFAEFAASRCRAAFYRARGFNAKPRASFVNPPDFIPLADFVSLAAYPRTQEAVIAFYAEAEKLTRFLSKTDKDAFLKFMETMSKGAQFESAMRAHFGRHFHDTAELEKAFKPYATSPMASDAN